MILKANKETVKEIAEFSEEIRRQATPPSDQAAANAIALYSSRALEPISPEYHQWIAKLQEKNPFIGKKYFEKATEHEQDYQMLGEPEEIIVDATEDGVTQALLDFAETLKQKAAEDDDLRVDLVDGVDEFENKFIDLAFVENKYPLLSDLTDTDELMAELEKALKELHDDDDYQTTVDLAATIETLKSGQPLLSDIRKVSGILPKSQQVGQ